MRTFPDKLNVRGANGKLLALFSEHAENVRDYVEVGCYEGHTAHHVIRRAKPGTTVHLLDYEAMMDRATPNVSAAASDRPDVNVMFYGNSDKTFDSYCWTLSKLMDEGKQFDFAYIDGAHTLHHDGLAFCLIDRMLRPGGIVCFDDYGWNMYGSKAMQEWEPFKDSYTNEQMHDHQVTRVVRQLVRTRPEYDEIVKNFAFRKRS